MHLKSFRNLTLVVATGTLLLAGCTTGPAPAASEELRRADYYAQLGRSAMERGRDGRAQLELTEALKRYQACEYIPGLVPTLVNLASVAYRQGRYDDATAHVEAALRLAEVAPGAFERGPESVKLRQALAEGCWVAALTALQGGKEALVKTWLERSREWASDAKALEGRLVNMEACLAVQGNPPNPALGLELGQKALALNKALGDRPEIARSLYWVGVAQREQGDFALARKNLEDALALNKSLGNSEGVLWCLRALEQVARQERRPEDAERLKVRAEAVVKAQQ